MWWYVSALDADTGMADYVAEVAVDADVAVNCWKGDLRVARMLWMPR